MDVSCSVRWTDLTDSKENKQAGRVGNASAGYPLKSLILWKLAERVGFEPTLPFRVNTLSKRAPSATRPSLRREAFGRNDSCRSLEKTLFVETNRSVSAQPNSMGELGETAT